MSPPAERQSSRPSDFDLDDYFREIEEAAANHLQAHGESISPYHIAIMRALGRSVLTPAGRAFKWALAPANVAAIGCIQTPEGRNLYRERLALTIERTQADELRALLGRFRWFKELPAKFQAELLRPPKRRELAEAIRREKELGSAETGRSPVETRPLDPEGRTRLNRALKLVDHAFEPEQLREARTKEDWETLATKVLEIGFAVVLALVPPPVDEPMGRRNRSPVWLETDRRICRWPGGCSRVVPNRSNLCLEHRLASKKVKDASKKAKLRASRSLQRTLRLIQPGALAPSTDAAGVESGSFEPGEDAGMRRRRLLGRG